MHRRLSSWLALVGTIPTFAGCSAGPSDEDYDDVASSIGALTASDAPAMDDSMTAAEGQEISGLTSEGSGTWSGERLGLSYRYELTCMDAGGEVMALCGDATDTAHLVVEWSGELDLPRLYASADRAGDW